MIFTNFFKIIFSVTTDEHMKRPLLTLATLVLSTHVFAQQPVKTVAQAPAPQAPAKAVATPAPAAELALDFALKSTLGKTVKLSDFKGKVVMVNFWATWCPPCRAEMPVLDALAKANLDAGLVVLGLNVDIDTVERDAYLHENPVSFTILDDSRWATAKLYIAPSQPATFFIDRQGYLAHVHQGYKSGDDALYAAKIKELLAK
jgi:thiol-disulfide isomerase/thioredoxin